MKTTQDIINEAAKKEAELSTKKTNRGEIRADYFVRGATFALSTPELWREHAHGFLNWIKIEYGGNVSEIDNEWLFNNYLEYLEAIKRNEGLIIKPGTIYTCHHKPSGEDWYLLGIDKKGNRVCAAGWPPTIRKLSDCENLEMKGGISEEEIKYRKQQFGDNWL